MKSGLLVGWFISILPLTFVQAQVQVTFGNISDMGGKARPNGAGVFFEQFGGLRVELHLHGDAVATARSLRLSVTSALDDTGADLAKPQSHGTNFMFLGNSPDLLTSLSLKEPATGAKTITTLTGEASLYEPQNDPDSTVIVQNIPKVIGTSVPSPALAAAGVQVTVASETPASTINPAAIAAGTAAPGIATSGSASITATARQSPIITGTNEDNTLPTPTKRKFRKKKKQNQNGQQFSIALAISDPSEKIVSTQFQEKSGTRINPSSTSTFNMFGKVTATYTFASPLPADAQLVIYLSTPKSYVKVPFSFSNIPLHQ